MIFLLFLGSLIFHVFHAEVYSPSIHTMSISSSKISLQQPIAGSLLFTQLTATKSPTLRVDMSASIVSLERRGPV